MTNKKTITSTEFKRVFWLNDNLDFCCSPLDAQHQVDYVSEWLAFHRAFTLNDSDSSSINPIKDIDKLFEIHQHLVIVNMGGFSTMLDSYRNKQTQPLPKQ